MPVFFATAGVGFSLESLGGRPLLAGTFSFPCGGVSLRTGGAGDGDFLRILLLFSKASFTLDFSTAFFWCLSLALALAELFSERAFLTVGSPLSSFLLLVATSSLFLLCSFSFFFKLSSTLRGDRERLVDSLFLPRSLSDIFFLLELFSVPSFDFLSYFSFLSPLSLFLSFSLSLFLLSFALSTSLVCSLVVRSFSFGSSLFLDECFSLSLLLLLPLELLCLFALSLPPFDSPPCLIISPNSA